MWSADSGKRIALLDGMHPGACQSVRFNPKYMMFATGCVNLVSTVYIVYKFAQAIQKKYFVCEKPHGQNESYRGGRKSIFPIDKRYYLFGLLDS